MTTAWMAAVVIGVLVVSPLAAASHCELPDSELWLEVDPSVVDPTGLLLPAKFRVFCADEDALRGLLAQAPPEFGRPDPSTPELMLPLPMPDGTIRHFAVVNSPILAPELAAEYPDIMTFALRGGRESRASGRLTETPSGLDVLIKSMDGLIRLNPVVVEGETYYLAFFNRDRTDGADDYDHPDDEQEPPGTGPAGLRTLGEFAKTAPLGHTTGPELRVYRLAATTTGEYFQARDGGGGAIDVLASMVAEINNVDLFFESEVAVRLVFSWAILFDDPDTDPYTEGATACQLRDENPAAVNSVITDADYDIGWVFGSGGGNGCAWYVVCLADKARGAGLVNTANVVPGGSTGLLAHEMGHQLGAHHTFSGEDAGCTAVEYNPGHGFEPGSGTTVMSYRGNCGTDDVDTSQVPAGRYYHAHSFDEIVENTTNGSGSGCGSVLATGNSAPIVDAGADYTIPRGTPFVLTGSAVDPDADPLTYTWEQFDVAEAPEEQRSIDTDTGEGPIIRSVPPGPQPVRTVPAMADILSNTQRPGEILPSTDRPLTFLLVARDNRPGGGGVAYDGVDLTVQGDPFFITAPNGGELLGAGCEVPVTWQVGGGDVAADVDLLFSADNGSSFGPLLGMAPNDGSADVELPCESTNQARIKAQAVGNIFFDVSDAPFFVSSVPPAVTTTATGGEVDDDCELLVEFEATAIDDCSVDADDVSAQVFKKPPGSFTVGPVQLNAQQVSSTEVHVTGSFLVSDLMESPAVMTIEVEALDGCGENGSDGVEIMVEDTTPPEITVSVEPSRLWPPNHRMRDILATVGVTDNCPGAGFVLTSVTSSEPDDGVGDGHTVDDIQGADIGAPDVELRLRSERSGIGPGRVYTLTWSATDNGDNATDASAEVEVPHGKKQAP